MNKSQAESINDQNLNICGPNTLSLRTTERDVTGYHTKSHNAVKNVPVSNTFVSNLHNDDTLDAALQHLDDVIPERLKSGQGQTHVKIAQSATIFIQTLTKTIRTLNETIQTLTNEATTGATHPIPIIDTGTSQSRNTVPSPINNATTTSLVTSSHSDSTKSSSRSVEKFETVKISPRAADQDALNDTTKSIRPNQKTSERKRTHPHSLLTHMHQQTSTLRSKDGPKDSSTPAQKLKRSDKYTLKALKTRRFRSRVKNHLHEAKKLLHLKNTSESNTIAAESHYIWLCLNHHQKISAPSPSTALLDIQKEPERARPHPPNWGQNAGHHRHALPNFKKAAHANIEKARRDRINNNLNILRFIMKKDPRLTTPPTAQLNRPQTMTESTKLIADCIEKHTPEQGYADISKQFQFFCLTQLEGSVSSDSDSPESLSDTSHLETPDSLSGYLSGASNCSSLESCNPPRSSFSSKVSSTADHFPNLPKSHNKSKTTLSPFSDNWMQGSSQLLPQTTGSSYQTFPPKDTTSQGMRHAPDLESWMQKNSQLLPQTTGSSYQTFPPKDTTSQGIRHAPDLESWMQKNSQLLPQTTGSSYQAFPPKDTTSQGMRHAPDLESWMQKNSQLLPQTTGSSYQAFPPKDTTSQGIRHAPDLESWMQKNSQLLPQTTGSSYQAFPPKDTTSQGMRHAPDLESWMQKNSQLLPQTTGSSYQAFPPKDTTSQGMRHAPDLESWMQKNSQLLPQTTGSSYQAFPPKDTTSQGMRHAPDLESWMQKNSQLLPQTTGSSYQAFPPKDTTSQGIRYAPDLESWMQESSQLLPQTTGSSYQAFPPKDTTSQGMRHAPDLESWMQKNSQLLPQTTGSSYQAFPPKDTTSQGIRHAPDLESWMQESSQLLPQTTGSSYQAFPPKDTTSQGIRHAPDIASTGLITSLHSDSARSSSKDIEEMPTGNKSFERQARDTSRRDTAAKAFTYSPEDTPGNRSKANPKQKGKNNHPKSMQDNTAKERQRLEEIQHILSPNSPQAMPKVTIIKMANDYIRLCQEKHQGIQPDKSPPGQPEKPKRVITRSLKSGREAPSKEDFRKKAHNQIEMNRQNMIRGALDTLKSTLKRGSGPKRSSIVELQITRLETMDMALKLIQDCREQHKQEQGYEDILSFDSKTSALADSNSSHPHLLDGLSHEPHSETPIGLSAAKASDKSLGHHNPESYNYTLPCFAGRESAIDNSPTLPESDVPNERLPPFARFLAPKSQLLPQTTISSPQISPPTGNISQGIQQQPAPDTDSSSTSDSDLDPA